MGTGLEGRGSVPFPGGTALVGVEHQSLTVSNANANFEDLETMGLFGICCLLLTASPKAL
jgi:hypothetical protein